MSAPRALDPASAAAPKGTRRIARRVLAVGGVVLIGLLGFLPQRARAAAFADGDEAGYVLAAGATVADNLFAVGQTVTIDGTVEGDLFAAGQDVFVNGSVTGSVFAGGSRVVIGKGGRVKGDVFAGGYEILVAGTVDGDVRGGGTVVRVADGGQVGGELMAGGFHVAVDRGGTVRRGLYAGGNQVALDGSVEGDANVGAGAIHLGGSIGGDAALTLSPQTGGPPPAMMAMMPYQSAVEMPATLRAGLTIEPSARVAGNLTTAAPAAPSVPAGVVGGEQSYSAVTAPTSATGAAATTPKPAPTALDWLKRWLRRSLALIALGALALWWRPGVVRAGADRVRTAPLPSAGVGLLSLAAAPVGIVVLLVCAVVVSLILGAVFLGNLIGPWLAFTAIALIALTAGLYLAVWLGHVSVAISLGHLLAAKLDGRISVGLLVGAPVVALLMLLPGIGGALHWCLAILGLGALALPWVRQLRADAPAPAAPA